MVVLKANYEKAVCLTNISTYLSIKKEARHLLDHQNVLKTLKHPPQMTKTPYGAIEVNVDKWLGLPLVRSG